MKKQNCMKKLRQNGTNKEIRTWKSIDFTVDCWKLALKEGSTMQVLILKFNSVFKKWLKHFCTGKSLNKTKIY